jgi:uncharacterized protein YjiS (DUF1127 family)
MSRLAFAPTPRATRAARTIWTAIQRGRRLRATIRELHGLNDRTLKDIGLRREDIEAVVREICRHR